MSRRSTKVFDVKCYEGMKNVKKQLPKFKSEDEEREFWSKHDSTDYLDWKNAEVVTLKPDKNSNLFRLLTQQAVSRQKQRS